MMMTKYFLAFIQDTIDAFVSLGGNEDMSGNVDANMLIKIIKDEF